MPEFSLFRPSRQNLDDFSIGGGDSAWFKVGADGDTGLLGYIVDRTSGLCFATWQWPVLRASGPNANLPLSGLSSVDCERLKKYESIKAYIETGKTP